MFLSRCLRWRLGPLAADPPCQLNVLWHDGHTLSMDGAQVGVLKQANKVCLSSLLEGKHRMALETQISFEVLCNFPDEPLEGQLPDQQLSALLILADLTEGNSSRAVAVRLLHSTSGGGRLTGSLGGKLLPGSLPSRGLASSLLGTSHRRVTSSIRASRRRPKGNPSTP